MRRVDNENPNVSKTQSVELRLLRRKADSRMLYVCWHMFVWNMLANTLLFLIRTPDMLSTLPTDTFKSYRVCTFGDSIRSRWSLNICCYESPYEALFHTGIGATETPATVWKNQEPMFNQFPKALVLQYRCGTYRGLADMRLFKRLFPVKPDFDLEIQNTSFDRKVNGQIGPCLVKIKTQHSMSLVFLEFTLR